MSQLTSLLWALAANTTLKAATLTRVNAEMKVVALPRLENPKFTLSHFDFRKRISVEHFTPLMFQTCRFASLSEIRSMAPIVIHDCDSLPDRLEVHDQVVEISKSKTGKTFETIEIVGSRWCSISQCSFVSAGKAPALQLKNADDVQIAQSVFANMTGRAMEVENSLVRLVSTKFTNLTAEEGAALAITGGHVKMSMCTFSNCRARKRAGAVLIHEKARLVVFERCVFDRNMAPVGRSISIDGAADISLSRFSGPLDDEIEGKNYLSWGSQFLMGARLAIDPPPTLLVPTQTPAPSPTGSPPPTVPLPTVDTRPTPTPIPATENKGAKNTMIVFVSVICAVVVVAVLIIVVVFLIRKKKSQIYPESDDGDIAKEPERTTVIVKNLYAVNTVIP